jgi:hypothetical protein
MSSGMIGTSVAQGVAQTAHNAQQVARQRDKRKADNEAAVHRVQERFDAHLRALEEGDPDASVTHLHVDEHLPGQSPADQLGPLRIDAHAHPHPRPQAQVSAVSEGEVRSAAPAEGDATAKSVVIKPTLPRTPVQDGPLYRHLDVQA